MASNKINLDIDKIIESTLAEVGKAVKGLNPNIKRQVKANVRRKLENTQVTVKPIHNDATAALPPKPVKKTEVKKKLKD